MKEAITSWMRQWVQGPSEGDSRSKSLVATGSYVDNSTEV